MIVLLIINVLMSFDFVLSPVYSIEQPREYIQANSPVNHSNGQMAALIRFEERFYYLTIRRLPRLRTIVQNMGDINRRMMGSTYSPRSTDGRCAKDTSRHNAHGKTLINPVPHH